MEINAGNGPDHSAEADQKTNLIISPALAERMDRALIDEDDVRRTIDHCEETGVKLLDSSTGDVVGHLRDGALTYWVRYRPVGTAFHLLDCYTHRTAIEEGSVLTERGAPSNMTCVKCSQKLAEQKTVFSYLGFRFTTPLPRCPACGQVYISDEFAAGKLSEVEATLEDK